MIDYTDSIIISYTYMCKFFLGRFDRFINAGSLNCKYN